MHARRALAVFATFVTAGTICSSSWASICADLNARLAATERPSATTDRQALRQELRRFQNIAAGQRCRPGFLFFGASGGPECERVLSRIRQLQAQLDNRNGYRSNFYGWPQDQRRAVLDQMARFNCPISPPAGANGYETVCVRHCDGYFFQISVSHGSGNFTQDAALCAAHYPDGQASLYYRPLGAEAEALISTKGILYTKQGFAFRYQATYDASCPRPLKMLSPKEMDDLQAAVDKYGLSEPDNAEFASRMPLPRAKPKVSSDPETAALRHNDSTLEAARQLIAAAKAPQSIRIVGPIPGSSLPDNLGAMIAVDRTQLETLAAQ